MKEKLHLSKWNKRSVLDFLKRYALITLGCILYGVSVTLFLDEGGLASGGVTGIAIIINRLTEWDTGLLVLLINIPLIILGYFFFGWRFTLSTLYTIAFSSFVMWLTGIVAEPHLPLPLGEYPVIINAVTGGVLFGLGMGLIFRNGSSSGGTDIPVKILRKKYRHIQTGYITLISDVIIVAASYFVFNNVETLFYTVLSVVVFTLVFDWVLYGGNSAKMVFVISEEEPAHRICDRVLKEIDTGATFVDAEGAYTGRQKRILLCVVKPFLYPKLRDVVHEEDKKAFIIVSSAKEIYGEGYQDAGQDEV